MSNQGAGWPGGNMQALAVYGSIVGFKRTDFAVVGGRSPSAKNVFRQNRDAASLNRSRVQFVGNFVGVDPADGEPDTEDPLDDSITSLDPEIGLSVRGNVMPVGFGLYASDGALSGIGASIRDNDIRYGANTWFFELANAPDKEAALSGVSFEENTIDTWAKAFGSNQLGARPSRIRFSRNRFEFPASRPETALHLEDANLSPGPHANDNDVDAQSNESANTGLNYPQLLPPASSDAHFVAGELATRSGTYVVEIFANESCSSSGHGPGQEIVGIGTVSVQDNGIDNGVSAFQIPVRFPAGFTGRVLTATATDQDGNTSEFSPCVAFAEPLPGIFKDGFETGVN